MKNKISIAIKLLVVIAFFGVIGRVSYVKIHEKILEDIKVVNHNSLYAENGYPVYTADIDKNNTAHFITDITLDGNNNDNRRYYSLVSQDKAKQLKVGSTVYVPKDEKALRTGFSWSDTSKYDIGKIVSVSSEADWRTGFYNVAILLDKELPKLPFYSAKVVTTTKRNIVVAPITNLESSEGNYYAWLVGDNSSAIKNLVETGVCDGYNCEIISGIKAGDKLVTSDTKLIEAGMLLNDQGEYK